MKLYPKIIVLSTLITGLHFLFRNQSATTEWFVWNFSNFIGGTSILSAFVFYYSTPFEKIGIKLFCLIYFILCIIDLLGWLYNGDQHIQWASICLLGLFGLYTLIKAHSWDVKHIKEWGNQKLDPEKFYVVFQRPTSFLTWLGSIFGYGVGSLHIVHNHQKHYMSERLKKFTQKYHNGEVRANEIAFDLQVATNDVHWFRNYLSRMNDMPFRLLKSNCLTSMKEAFEVIGVKPRTMLPSRYIKTFLKK